MSSNSPGPSFARAAFGVGGWTVEPQANRVGNGERTVHLEPKVMDVLLCLAGRPGEVVSRQTLVDEVWATEFISDTTLTHAIAELRRAFGDDARSPHVIETIPKRGYRMIAEVVGDPGRPSPSPAQEPGRPRPYAVIAGETLRLDPATPAVGCAHVLLLADGAIPLLPPEVVVGRGAEADLQVLSPEVSRRHARLAVEGERVLLEDLGSKNGTLVNDLPVAGRRELISGDTLAVGPARLLYRGVANDPTRTRTAD
ncbi:MAG: winged helix-turn-helix domain-containing protein [Thermoanaerobaculales bacterium]|jgi:DNA-binding winged helix-turn-helix (wHTH) protein|nr:winged helix-turn-helix domain-containing protein [Thermoanaerobaculales bacterium]